MRVQLSPISNTRIHFREDCIDGEFYRNGDVLNSNGKQIAKVVEKKENIFEKVLKALRLIKK